jgi:Tryptophan synthase alpha chain
MLHCVLLQVLSLYAIETMEGITNLQNAAANADPLAVVLHANMLNSTVSTAEHTLSIRYSLSSMLQMMSPFQQCESQSLLCMLTAPNVAVRGESQVITELQKAQHVQGIIIIDTPPPADAHVSI